MMTNRLALYAQASPMLMRAAAMANHRTALSTAHQDVKGRLGALMAKAGA